MYQVTTFSNRLYADENSLSNEIIAEIEDTIYKFNNMKFSTYNLLFNKEVNNEKYVNTVCGKSGHVYTKYKFNTSDYYVNSVVNLAKGMIKSESSNRKNYIEETNEKIKTVEDNIQNTQNKLDKFIDFRAGFILARKFILENKNHYMINDIIKELDAVDKLITVTIDKIIVSKPFAKDKDIYGWFAFEYNYLNPKIANLRNQLSGYKYRLNILKEKLEKLHIPKHSIFGTKHKMVQYCRGNISKDELMKQKYKSFEISGRNDSIYGNFVFKPTYNHDTDSFDFNITAMSGNIISINNVKFPYRQKELIEILTTNRIAGHRGNENIKGNSLCFGIVHKYDNNDRYYYQITLTLDIEKPKEIKKEDDNAVLTSTNTTQNKKFRGRNLKYINYNTSTGIIGVDFNYGHIDMTELDGKGNLLYYKTIYYDLDFNSQKNEESLRKALNEVGEYAKSKGKIIAVEDINLYKSNFKASKDKKRQKVLNYTLHRLPYSRYLEIVDYLRIKFGLDIIKVKPAYTSIIGKLKYSYTYKLNIHIAASYVIGRRALGLKEKPLSCFNKLLLKKKNYIHKTEWGKWSYLNKIITV